MALLPQDANVVMSAIAAFAKADKNTWLLTGLESANPQYDWFNQDWGIDYYDLVLSLPFEEYVRLDDKRDEKEKQLSKYAAKATEQCSDAKVSSVKIRFDLDTVVDWRSGERPIQPKQSDSERIWKSGHFRLFASHVTKHKKEVHAFKESCAKRGIDLFVAHDDIAPSTTWQREIESALASCHAVVALVTEEFHDSVWCMQEVGWALGRGVMVLPVKTPSNPKGFLGEIQAVPGSLDDPANLRDSVASIFASHEQTSRQMHEPLVATLERAVAPAAALILLRDLNKTVLLSSDYIQRVRNAVSSKSKFSSDKTITKEVEALINRFDFKPQPAPAEDEFDPFADD